MPRTSGMLLLAASVLAVCLLLALQAGSVHASLCVWRNPDSDIATFFGGGTYRTVLARVGGKQTTIERLIGTRLDADENELKFWPVIKNGKRVGTVASHLGKGDYGAVEVIMAIVDPSDGPPKIKAVHIQRDRERYREALRSPAFLNQFVGKTAASTLKVGQDIKAADPGAVTASRVVALSVKKLLVAYEQLGVANR
jgi:hypothetical protein